MSGRMWRYAMKAVILTAVITLLAGCAGTSGYSSSDTTYGTSSGSSDGTERDPLARDPIFNSWVN